MTKRKPPLTAAVLDKMQCESPNCNHKDHPELYFTQHCHPGARLDARYVRAEHTLVLSCAHCELTVATLRVAQGDE